MAAFRRVEVAAGHHRRVRLSSTQPPLDRPAFVRVQATHGAPFELQRTRWDKGTLA